MAIKEIMQNKAAKWICSGLVACFIGSAAIPESFATETARPTPTRKTINDKTWVIDYMASRGITSFLMMDKRAGTLTAIKDGRMALTIPAISGRQKDDDVHTSDNTPAGIWPMTVSYDQYANDAAILFFDGDKFGLNHSKVIHRAVDIRNHFLMARNPNSRRRSDGCIALKNAPDGYDAISGFVETIPEQELKDSNRPASRFLVVLPEKTSAKTFFSSELKNN